LDAFNLLAILISLAAIFAWANARFIRLPNTIGLLILSLLFSLCLVLLGDAGWAGSDALTRILEGVDLSEALLNGMLGALLFAGALHLDLDDLRERRWVIATLATVGVLISTTVVGFGSWLLFRWLGLEIPLIHAFLFGALISPTDPITVGAILRKAGVPPSLMVKISGESLFNDGVGVVLFILILELATGTGGHGTAAAHGVVAGAGEAQLGIQQILHLAGLEIGGGILFGLALGWIVYLLLASVDDYQVEILLTVAMVTGGYALAQQLGVSGPLAMVVAGLLIGNPGRKLAMSDEVIEHMDPFWELVDEFLNAVLFVMIGLEVMILDFDGRFLVAGLAAIPLVMAARWMSVGVPITILRSWRTFSPHVVKILTWSGLRGGISVALVLSIQPGPTRDLLLTTTYIVVIFSIVVQGLTVGPLARRLSGTPDPH
jgi:CPA1 family monovalent cation:H+ antiporter